MLIMNASGCHCTTFKELVDLYENDYCDIVVSKSCTIKSCKGNPEPRYYDTNALSINSTGLRNKGLYFYLSMALYFNNLYDKADYEIINNRKKYIISFADLVNIEKFMYNVNNYYYRHKFPLYFEINLSCPNIPGKGQIGYNFTQSYRLLHYIFKNRYSKNIHIGVKLPPYFDTIHFTQMANVLNQFPLSHITCINSLGNGYVFNKEIKQSIAGNNGYGGIGGSVIKPFGLSNVRKFDKLLRKGIIIYGCGGIVNALDIYEYEKCGAVVVQIGTELYKNGIDIFKKLKIDYKQYKNNLDL